MIRSFWGQSSWVGGGNLGKIDQIVKLFYFSANLQNEIKSFDPSIDHPIAEVLLGGFCLNHNFIPVIHHTTAPSFRHNSTEEGTSRYGGGTASSKKLGWFM
jgi:hypothetical protein